MNGTRKHELSRDFVVSTTYRKLEQRGAKWDQLTQGDPTGGHHGGGLGSPVELERLFAHSVSYRRSLQEESFRAIALAPSLRGVGDVGSLQAGAGHGARANPQRKLSTITDYCGTPIRWEPLNGASQHRGIPSAGGLFSAEMLIICRHGDGIACFAYVPHYRVLRHLFDSSSLEVFLADGDLAFVVVGNLADCIFPYGEFAPTLVALEAGILSSQIVMLCQALGWTATACLTHDYGRAASELNLGHWSRLPLAVISVAGDGTSDVLHGLAHREMVASLPVRNLSMVETFDRLRALVGEISNGSEALTSPRAILKPNPRAHIIGGPDLIDIIRRRSSGQGQAWASSLLPLRHAHLNRIWSVKSALDDFTDGANLQESQVTVAAAVQYSDGCDGSYLAVDEALRPSDRIASARGRGSGDSARLNKLIFTLGVDDLAAEQKHGPRGFVTNHIAAGAACQKLGLAAAESGLFARPLRGYIDHFGDEAFTLDRRAILQLACDFFQCSNPAYPLSLA